MAVALVSKRSQTAAFLQTTAQAGAARLTKRSAGQGALAIATTAGRALVGKGSRAETQAAFTLAQTPVPPTQKTSAASASLSSGGSAGQAVVVKHLKAARTFAELGGTFADYPGASFADLGGGARAHLAVTLTRTSVPAEVKASAASGAISTGGAVGRAFVLKQGKAGAALQTGGTTGRAFVAKRGAASTHAAFSTLVASGPPTLKESAASASLVVGGGASGSSLKRSAAQTTITFVSTSPRARLTKASSAFATLAIFGTVGTFDETRYGVLYGSLRAEDTPAGLLWAEDGLYGGLGAGDGPVGLLLAEGALAGVLAAEGALAGVLTTEEGPRATLDETQPPRGVLVPWED